MKKIKSFIPIALFAILLSGCSSNTQDSDIYLKKPKDTNLEFWITQRVTLKELEDKGCTYLPGWMGADEYLDSRYVADTSGEMLVAPSTHVTYLVNGYPDTLDDKAITRIEITDPRITVYGLNLDSTDNAIISRMEKIADSFSYITTTSECYLSVGIKNCSFSFMSEKIVISVPVTNNSSVQY